MIETIHARALEASSRYKKAEADLIEILQELEAHQVFLKRGHSSLFQYVVSELGLGENITYSLITVARKAREVPELKAQLRTGAMTLSNARRVVSVINEKNQAEWIEKATTLSSRQLEKAIAEVRPQEVVEHVGYVGKDRVRMEVGVTEQQMLKLRRVQDLLKGVSLEKTLEVLTEDYLRRHDPIERAKRHQVRKSVRKLVTRRDGISAATLHQVNLRDQRRCTYTKPDGSRCNQSRWTEVHHIIPRSAGGPHTLENLTTLCSAHHRLAHLRA